MEIMAKIQMKHQGEDDGNKPDPGDDENPDVQPGDPDNGKPDECPKDPNGENPDENNNGNNDKNNNENSNETPGGIIDKQPQPDDNQEGESGNQIDKGQELTISKEIIRYLRDSDPNGTYSVKHPDGDFELLLPIAALPSDQGVRINISRQSSQGALGSVFSINLQREDGSEIVDLGQTPATLKFVIDPSKVSSWKDVVVYAVGQNGQMQGQAIPPFDINEETGEVWVKVSKLGTYGVFDASVQKESKEERKIITLVPMNR